MSLIRPFSDVDLHAFVDDQVSPERRTMIANYLKSTPAEAARVESWRRQNDAIRNVFAGAAAEPVPIWLTIGQVASGKDRQELTGGERGLAGRAGGSRGLRWRLRKSGIGAPIAVTAVIVSAFAAGLVASSVAPQWTAAVERWLPGSPRTEALEGFAKRSLEAHRIYGLDPDRPAEMANTKPGDLDAWFLGRLAFPVRIPDLRPVGWTLKGGRVIPGEIGAAALLVYEDAVGDRLSLTIGRIDNPAPFDTTYTMLGGPVLAWMDGPLAFGITASREGAWLSDHARTLYRAVYQSRSE